MSAAAGRARVFVALALGPSLGTELAAAVAPTLDPRAFRALAGEDLHLTLAFLGELERGRLAPLGTALLERAAGLARPKLRLAGTGAFPDLARPRVLWVGVEERAPSGRLLAAHAAVGAALGELELGLARDPAPFVPHVTVARARRRVAAPAAFAALAPALDFAPEGLVLFESQLTAAERRYEPLAQAPFARE